MSKDTTTPPTGSHSFSRYALVVFATFYTFSFVGALFGFGPMEVMLVESGAFQYLCGSGDDPSGGCTAQTNTIVNMGFLATCCSVLTPFIGFAIDHYGAPTVSYGMSFLALAGTGLMVLAAYTQISWIYYPSFAFLGMATFTGSLMSVQVGLYFQGHTQVRIIMWLNTLFDAGSCSYLFLWMINENMDVDFFGVAMIYFALAVALYIPASYFWTVAVPEGFEGDSFVPEDDEAKPLTGDHHPHASERSQSSNTSIRQSLRLFMESNLGPATLDEVVMSRKGSLLPSEILDHRGLVPATIYGSIRETDDSVDADEELLADKPANDQLKSLPYMLLVFFFSISQISCNWSLITAADFLADLGDDGLYLKIFTLTQPASILALPLVDWIIRNHGFGAAFQGVNLINFVYIAIKVFSKDLHVQVATFVMVATVRCFLYATVFSFLPSLLSGDVVGRGTGFLCMTGGIASFLNIPLNSFFVAGGDFLTPNLIYLGFVLPCTGAAWSVSRTIAREKKIKEMRAGGAPLPMAGLSH